MSESNETWDSQTLRGESGLRARSKATVPLPGEQEMKGKGNLADAATPPLLGDSTIQGQARP